MKDWSQDGEQAILMDLCGDALGITRGVALEFGGSDGATNSNIRWCVEDGWRVVYWDINPRGSAVDKVEVSPENINGLVAAHDLWSVDIVSIDIDSLDYWVWRNLAARPKIVAIEYNGNLPPGRAVTVPCDPGLRFNRTDYYGASFEALARLGIAKGYQLHAATGVNMIFVRADLGVAPRTVERPQRPRGWPPDNRGLPWIKV